MLYKGFLKFLEILFLFLFSFILVSSLFTVLKNNLQITHLARAVKEMLFFDKINHALLTGNLRHIRIVLAPEEEDPTKFSWYIFKIL